jgi:SAM-dependent methyltransferase
VDLTGLAAQTWDDFAGGEPHSDAFAFRHLIENNPGPVLDVGCGPGRLLIPFLASGIHIEGVDSSEEALAICKAKAAAMGLTPVLYHQAMQRLELPTRYATIIIPGGSFHLVTDRDEATEALRRLASHLEDGGILAMSLDDPVEELSNDPALGWRPHGKAIRSRDGAELRQDRRTVSVDGEEQVETTEIRYRVILDRRIVQEEFHMMKMRLYYWPEIRRMLEEAGFGEVRAHSKTPGADHDEPRWRSMVVAKR